MFWSPSHSPPPSKLNLHHADQKNPTKPSQTSDS